MNANELITRMTEIETEVGMHKRALADLQSEGQGLFAEFESWRLGLAFATSVVVPGPASKTAAKRQDDGKSIFKLPIKRAIKAKGAGSFEELAAVAGSAALKVAHRRGMPEVPAWVSQWADTQIAKLFPSPVEAPAEKVEETGETAPVPVEAPRSAKRKK